MPRTADGIVHRDLKPANVMLTNSGWKLLDFGLAKTAAPWMSGSGGRRDRDGRAQNLRRQARSRARCSMSPEQLEGRPVDARSDIFALGAVLHEMVTGAEGVHGEQSDRAGRRRFCISSRPAWRRSSPRRRRVLDRLVRMCLAKDPDERWQTAHDVKLQLVSVQEEGVASQVRVTPASRSARTGSVGGCRCFDDRGDRRGRRRLDATDALGRRCEPRRAVLDPAA